MQRDEPSTGMERDALGNEGTAGSELEARREAETQNTTTTSA